MAKSNKILKRALRCVAAIMLMTALMTGMAYGQQEYGIINEFIGEKGTKPVKPPVTETVTVEVTKVWAPAEGAPDSVSVQLYRDGSPYYNAVILNAANGWEYAWDNLEKNRTWTVDEPVTPEGYTKTVTGSVSSGFVITNTMESDGSVSGGGSGGGAGVGGGGNRRGGDESTNIGEGATPTAGRDAETGGSPGSIPKTSDDADPRLWLLILAASTIALRRVLLIKKNKGKEKIGGVL